MKNPITSLFYNSDAATLGAFEESQAIIEFDLDGTILRANENFLTTMGYSASEIVGKHHRIFMPSTEVNSPAYQQFWNSLRQGQFQRAEYMRLGKGGREVWLQASYNPIKGPSGKPIKIVKIATDITEQKLRAAEYESQLNAIGRSQAVIEFALDGTVLTANENFLKALGYTLAEIKGKHHSLFVEAAFSKSHEYQSFWAKLSQGQFISAEFKRIGKGGREVWIQATYNPVFDPQGRPVKVVKYAIDVTETVNQRLRAEVVGQKIDTNLAQIVQSISGINHQTGLVASAATQTSSSFQTVAASAEELAASIGEVANSVVRSKTSVDGAMDHISAADEEAHRLIVAAEAMSSVTKFIQDIASSINLLALNATIESARAGEAGRGFAVVAGEVKTLAQQVAQATETISREITGIQSISNGVSAALSKIGGAMADVQGLVSGVAGAIEQQTAVTRDISSNMNNTAGAVTNIEESMHSILQSVDSARGLSNESLRLYAQLQKAS